MFKSEINLIVFSLFIFVFLPLSSKAEWKTLKSPSNNFCTEFSLSPEWKPIYKVTQKGKSIIEPSGLGFIESEGIDWAEGFDGVDMAKKTEVNREWKDWKFKDHSQGKVEWKGRYGLPNDSKK